MKRFLITSILIFMFVASCAWAAVRNVQDNYQFTYSLADTSGDPVTGETVNLKIKRVSDGYYLDFNDTTFKNTGWTSVQTALSEDSQGEFYYHTFNPPASETGAEQYVFCIDNASATYGDHQCITVTYQDVGNSDVTDASVRSEIDSNSTQLAAIVADTNELQIDLTDGGRLDLLIDAILADTGELQTNQNWDVWDDATRSLTILDEDTTTIDLDATTVGDVTASVSVDELTAAALADMFNTDSGTTAGSAVAGSPVKEIVDNAGGGGLTASSIADAVWDEAIAGHLTAGSTGQALNAAGGSGDPWNTSLPGSYTSGQAGKILSDIFDATDGDKESGSYTGIENTIRRTR